MYTHPSGRRKLWSLFLTARSAPDQNAPGDDANRRPKASSSGRSDCGSAAWAASRSRWAARRRRSSICSRDLVRDHPLRRLQRQRLLQPPQPVLLGGHAAALVCRDRVAVPPEAPDAAGDLVERARRAPVGVQHSEEAFLDPRLRVVGASAGHALVGGRSRNGI
jgi:hypothetical protein